MNTTDTCCTAHPQESAVQHFLMPCPFKKITGMDCPGCGFQRSSIALIKGDFAHSFSLYPATIPLYLLFAVALVYRIFPGEKGRILLTIMIWFSGIVIIGAYGWKIWTGRLHDQ